MVLITLNAVAPNKIKSNEVLMIGIRIISSNLGLSVNQVKASESINIPEPATMFFRSPKRIITQLITTKEAVK